MKPTFKHIFALSLSVILTSCAEDVMNTPGSNDEKLPISISAAYPTATRASDAGFEDGDNMGIYVLDYNDDTPQGIADADIHAGNVRFRFDGTNNTWNGATTVYWSSSSTPADIIGYYPFSSSIDDASAVPFSISRRQDLTGDETSTGGYEASDFLWAKAEKAMPTSSRVDLTFRHLMAGIRVTLTEGSGFAEGEWRESEKNVLVSNIVPTATVNLSDGSVKAGDDNPISVTPYGYNGEWRAVVVPQTVAPGNIISVSIDGTSYNLVKGNAITYQSGKLHTFTITVNKRSASGDYEFKLTDEAITVWIDDVDFHDGIVRNYLTVNVENKGNLQEVIENTGYSTATITALKLTGEIDENDFQYMREKCPALRSLNLSEVTVWDGNRENVIPAKAMYEKKTLSHVLFPDNLKIIGSAAFYRTGLIGSLIIPEGVEKVGEEPFVEDGTAWGTDIGAFSYCDNLIGELSLPSTLKYIESGAFGNCRFTGSLILPQSLKVIGNSAFDANNFNGELNIPENIEIIGARAFYGNSFTGNLIIPSNIKKIYAYTFGNCKFNTLVLPEHLIEIGKYAFDGCDLKGELLLPSSLKVINNRAFSDTKISSIFFPEGLEYIGDGAFMNCRYLRGEMEIPKKVARINDYLFKDCGLITGVKLHKDIISVGGAAFYGCHALTKIVCDNPAPPLIKYLEDDRYAVLGWDIRFPVSPFDGISTVNVSLEVPKESVASYRSAKGWKEIGRISEHYNFVCQPASACALTTRHQETLILNSEGEWVITHKPDWCDISKTSGTGKAELTLTVNELSKGSGNRADYVEFSLKGTEFTTKCEVSQYDCQYGEDECITLQRATRGNGIDILFLGDGFDAEAISTGKYLDLVNEQMEAFFGVEPFTTYRDYFNVYACISLSQESGINTANTWRNTRFTTLYTIDCDGNGHLQPDDADYVFDYAVAKSPLVAEKMQQSLIIMSLNSDEYGSETTITWYGSPIAICCRGDVYPMDTRGIIQHEACGHAFGKLAEERIVTNKYISGNEKSEIMDKQNMGWYQNISLSGKMAEVPWSHFIFNPRYSNKVDVFEGTYGKTRGVYRSEINSCMNYGIPYFNAISRQDIVRRILDYSGEEFTMEKFYAADSDKWGTTGSSRAAMVDEQHGYTASATHHPVRIIKSKKY